MTCRPPTSLLYVIGWSSLLYIVYIYVMIWLHTHIIAPKIILWTRFCVERITGQSCKMSIFYTDNFCPTIYGWNFSRCIFSPNIVTFFATLTAVFLHFLHWFYCFNYFYGSITCARVGKTKFLTRHLRLGTWKVSLNMDDFEVFSHFFPFCISSKNLKLIQNLQESFISSWLVY